MQFFGFPRRIQENDGNSMDGCLNKMVQQSKHKKYKWKKTNFKTSLPKYDPVVIYVTANTKNVQSHQCMMHAGSLSHEFDSVYTSRGHGRELRLKNTKLIPEDENADLEVHERIVFCHIRDMRENSDKKHDKKSLPNSINSSLSKSDAFSVQHDHTPLAQSVKKRGRPRKNKPKMGD